jgi:hypothetical protein
MQSVLNPLSKIETTDLLQNKIKKKIYAKMKNVDSAVSQIETLTGVRYPPYYIEPVLTVTTSQNVIDGLGVLYARTIPIEKTGKIQIVVQITAPLVLFGTKVTVRLILAHEFLHYLELVRNFSRGLVTSQIVSNSIYEEHYSDSSRAVEPSKVFKNKKLVADLKKRMKDGLNDEKLNEKCNTNWIEKGLPLGRISMGQNQVHLSMDSVFRSSFDNSALDFLKKMEQTAGRGK